MESCQNTNSIQFNDKCGQFISYWNFLGTDPVAKRLVDTPQQKKRFCQLLRCSFFAKTKKLILIQWFLSYTRKDFTKLLKMIYVLISRKIHLTENTSFWQYIPNGWKKWTVKWEPNFVQQCVQQSIWPKDIISQQPFPFWKDAIKMLGMLPFYAKFFPINCRQPPVSSSIIQLLIIMVNQWTETIYFSFAFTLVVYTNNRPNERTRV